MRIKTALAMCLLLAGTGLQAARPPRDTKSQPETDTRRTVATTQPGYTLERLLKELPEGAKEDNVFGRKKFRDYMDIRGATICFKVPVKVVVKAGESDKYTVEVTGKFTINNWNFEIYADAPLICDEATARKWIDVATAYISGNVTGVGMDDKNYPSINISKAGFSPAK